MDFNNLYELFNEDQQLAKGHFIYQQYIQKTKATALSRIDAFWTDNKISLKLNKFNIINVKS